MLKNMKPTSRNVCSWIIWGFLFNFLLVLQFSCGGQTYKSEKTEHAMRLAGTWSLKARIAQGEESPVTERFMKLVLQPGGTFRAEYRWDQAQGWIPAGQGGFSYAPPNLTLFWEAGAVSNLLVSEIESDKILLHHGRNLAPLKDQEPDEIFVRLKIEKGPTRSPS